MRVVAGSAGMSGAGWLVAAAAMRGGAGIVHASAPGAEGRWPIEVVGRGLPTARWAGEVLADLGRFGALVVGPGLGRELVVAAELDLLVAGTDRPLVVDADAISLLDRSRLRDRRAATVLTPHDGELAALTGERPGADRFAAARDVAGDLGVILLLKGPTTVVAAPDGFALAVDEGDQRLATAGSGDVLSGLIGAYLARGVDPLHAAAAAAFVPGRAGRSLPLEGVIAGDLLDELGPALESCR